MPSLTFRGVKFFVYTDDHEPRHIHCFAGGVEVIINLPEDGVVVLARDGKGVFSGKVKRNDLKRILSIAVENFDELVNLWEEIHG